MLAQPVTVVVVGGSYVGCAVAQKLSNLFGPGQRVILIEPHSHFHHLFAFPRFAVVPNHEHKAFIPYSGLFSQSSHPELHEIIQARAIKVDPHCVTLDRMINGSNVISHDYVIMATGTKLSPPGNVESDEKGAGVRTLQNLQASVAAARKICIVGGGAVGVQMALDLKEIYGSSKEVTLIHSRPNTLSRFHPKLHKIVASRAEQLGVELVLGSRALVPNAGFPLGLQTEPYAVETQNGRQIECDLVIHATGQTPNSSAVAHLAGIVAKNGYISVRPTLQFDRDDLFNMFAVGDIADTSAHKAARPGVMQADVVARNLVSLIKDENTEATYEVHPAAIHLSLGLEQNVLFIDPPAGSDEPRVVHREDGKVDMGVERQWKSRNVKVVLPEDFYL